MQRTQTRCTLTHICSEPTRVLCIEKSREPPAFTDTKGDSCFSHLSANCSSCWLRVKSGPSSSSSLLHQVSVTVQAKGGSNLIFPCTYIIRFVTVTQNTWNQKQIWTTLRQEVAHSVDTVQCVDQSHFVHEIL